MTQVESRDRPILFSGPMVRAILDGSKTQTRRIVKLPPRVTKRPGPHTILFYNTGSAQYHGGHSDYTGDQPPGLCVRCGDDTVQRVPSPYGIPGDWLWVRETFAFGRGYDATSDGKPRLRAGLVPKGARLAYAADGKKTVWAGGWRPSIHMPRWSSRIPLKVTGMRVERLQDINDGDALAEGVRAADGMAHVTAFAELWDSLNAKRGFSWESNRWVWVVEFRKV